MSDDRQIYTRLIARIFAAGVDIHESGLDETCYRKDPPRIDIKRMSGGAAHFHDAARAEAEAAAEALFSGAKDAIEETCLLAHEFGHHGSPHEHYEAVMERRESHGREAITSDERGMIHAEERRAWVEAIEVLRQLGFTDWERFCEVSARTLKTYDAV